MTETRVVPDQPKKRNTTLIIVIVAIVLLCSCCIAVIAVLLWNYGDQLLGISKMLSHLII